MKEKRTYRVVTEDMTGQPMEMELTLEVDASTHPELIPFEGWALSKSDQVIRTDTEKEMILQLGGTVEELT